MTLAGHDDGNMPVCANARCPLPGEVNLANLNSRRALMRPAPNSSPAGVAAPDVEINLWGRWQEGRIVRSVDSTLVAFGHVSRMK